jgi:hypothetical protein
MVQKLTHVFVPERDASLGARQFGLHYAISRLVNRFAES